MRIHIRKSQYAFTIMELMIVVMILGMIAAFGIPTYNRSRERVVEKDAIHSLRVIAAAMEVYKVRDDDGDYPPTVDLSDLDDINTILDLGIIAQSMAYSCINTVGGANFTCTANPDDPNYGWKVRVRNADLGIPVCSPGPPCPTL